MVEQSRSGQGLSRRDFLKTTGTALGAGALAPLLFPGAACAANDRPDVLFIAVEDLAASLGCYGHPMVKTPHLDALAATGVRFDRAYCPAPLCNPSRASVSTGLHPTTLGVFRNEQDWRRRIPEGVLALPEFFRDQGYETVTGGKIHHSHKLFKDPWEEGRQRERRMWRRRLRYRGKWGGRSVGTRPKAPCPLKLPDDHYIRRSLCWGASGVSPEDQVDGAIARAAAEELARKHDKPLYMALGFHAPHYALLAPQRFVDMYKPADVELPTFPADDLADVPIKYGVFNTLDQKWLDADEKREVIAAYYACISYVDWCVGIVTDALRRTGRDKRTVVVFWGDHGMHMGEHGLWRKMTAFEESTRVPFLVRVPGARANGRPTGRLAEMVDIYPTLADACGFEPPGHLEGLSLLPLVNEPDRPWRQAAFMWRHGPRFVSLRTERYRYTQHGSPHKAELYDHDTDPHEFTNLAKDPKHAATVAEMCTLLKAGWRGARPA